jgi:hypothetical protein
MPSTTKRVPLTTKFAVPPGTHTVLVVTAHYWGRGKTKAEAMAECKRRGGKPGLHGYIAYYFGEGFKPDTGWVDDFGFVHWEYSPNIGATRGIVPAKEEVGLD